MKALFEVNAQQILAKLHLAAKEQANVGSNTIVVNTGILNDKNAKPEKPGDVSFDLKNSSHTYQVGIIQDIQYSIDFNDPANILADLRKLKDIVVNDVEKKGIADKNIKETPAIDELKTKINNALESAKSQKVKDIKSKLDSNINKSADEINKDKTAVSLATSVGIQHTITELEEIIKDEKNAPRKDGKAQQIEKTLATVIKQLTAYLTTFAGKDNVKAISEDNVMIFDVPNNIKNANDKRLVSTFQIQPATEAEIEAMNAKFKSTAKDGIAQKCISKMCFCVNYTLEVEK